MLSEGECPSRNTPRSLDQQPVNGSFYRVIVEHPVPMWPGVEQLLLRNNSVRVLSHQNALQQDVTRRVLGCFGSGISPSLSMTFK